MLIKFKLVLAFIFCAVLVFAAEETGKKKTRTQKRPQTKSSSASRPANPMEPTVRKADVDYLLKRIKESFIDNKIPENLSVYYNSRKTRNQKNRFIYKSEFSIIISALRKHVVNPDLEEATGLRKSWFVSVGKNLAPIEKCIISATYAIGNRNDKEYRKNIAWINYYAKRLEPILKNPVKIPKDEWNAIREKNIQRRFNEQQKKGAE